MDRGLDRVERHAALAQHGGSNLGRLGEDPAVGRVLLGLQVGAVDDAGTAVDDQGPV